MCVWCDDITPDTYAVNALTVSTNASVTGWCQVAAAGQLISGLCASVIHPDTTLLISTANLRQNCLLLISLLSILGQVCLGYWHQMATLPQGNQELLVVKDKVGRPPGELGASKSMECDIFRISAWHCWLGDRKGIRSVKKLDVGLLVVMIWLELCTSYSSSSPVATTASIILCFNKHQLTQVHLENGH